MMVLELFCLLDQKQYSFFTFVEIIKLQNNKFRIIIVFIQIFLILCDALKYQSTVISL